MATPTSETYGALQDAYDFFNRRLFRGSLPPCMFTVTRNPCTAGYFLARRWARIDTEGPSIDEISINPLYFKKLGLQESMQTLVHEMCHGWQHHHGKPSRNGYHNAEWANKMQRVGLMPSATGQPGGNKTGQHMQDYAIEGGRFLLEFHELLEQGFKLRWHDQMLELMHKENVNAMFGLDAFGEPLEGYGLAEALNDKDGEGERPRPSGAGLVASLAAKPGQRLKFHCDGCGLNAWAKPSARLRCDECDCILVPTTSRRRSSRLTALLQRLDHLVEA